MVLILINGSGFLLQFEGNLQTLQLIWSVLLKSSFISSAEIKELKFLTIIRDSEGEEGVFAIQHRNIMLALLIKVVFAPLISLQHKCQLLVICMCILCESDYLYICRYIFWCQLTFLW